MRGVSLFMVLVALPALVALGHDCYLFYMNPDMGFQFAALGFIWTRYEPESYRWVVETTTPDGYWQYINFILTQKAVLIGALFAGFFYVIIGILKIFGAGPFRDTELLHFQGHNRVDTVMNRGKGKAKKFQYKRK